MKLNLGKSASIIGVLCLLSACGKSRGTIVYVNGVNETALIDESGYGPYRLSGKIRAGAFAPGDTVEYSGSVFDGQECFSSPSVADASVTPTPSPSGTPSSVSTDSSHPYHPYYLNTDCFVGQIFLDEIYTVYSGRENIAY